jgi:hypothetical protein
VTNNNGSRSDDFTYWPFFTITLSYHQYNSYSQAIQLYRWFTHFPIHRCTCTRILSLHYSLLGSGSQHRDYHFKSLWSLLVISSSITLECLPSSPVSVLHGTNLYSTNLRDLQRHIYYTRYIDAARICIAENMSRDRHSLLCDVQRAPCIATAIALTQRKHFHSIVAWSVCWNKFTGQLPSNALIKSVTIYYNRCIRIRIALNKSCL